jgi:hypothetical protein
MPSLRISRRLTKRMCSYATLSLSREEELSAMRIRNGLQYAVAAFLGLSMVACAADKPDITVDTNPSPYSSGKTHSEPLFYNGKTYQVQFRHDVAQQVYHVNVSAAGRVLGKSAGDSRIVSEVGRNAINHFACQSGQKAEIIPGSAKPTAAGWSMQARCVQRA